MTLFIYLGRTIATVIIGILDVTMSVDHALPPDRGPGSNPHTKLLATKMAECDVGRKCVFLQESLLILHLDSCRTGEEWTYDTCDHYCNTKPKEDPPARSVVRSVGEIPVFSS